MDAIFVDVNGNKRNFLYQYDKGQYLVIEDFEYSVVTKVQFQIKSMLTALSVKSAVSNSTLRVSIPDTLLTFGEDIAVYVYIEDEEQGNVIETIFISVIPRKKPENYTYTSETFTRTVNGTTISDGFGFSDTFLLENENEDISGYFININENQTVRKATSINDVHGVAVSNPGFAANCNDEKLDPYSGNLLSQYVYVCSFGLATVIDNGICEIGKMCVPSSDGIAIPSQNTVGYKVIDRIDDNHILIFVDPSMSVIHSVQTDLTAHKSNQNNPHSVTKAQIGLGNVNNTSDLNKPISNKTKAALDNKADLENGVLKSTQLPSHSSTHAIGGSDAISYSDIGAAGKDHTHAINEINELQETLNTKPTLIDGKLSKEILPDDIASNIVVETIADRDELDPFEGLFVHVKNASGDDASSGVYADYIYDGDVWVQTGGYVSSDGSITEIGSVDWANITNKPTSFVPKVHASTHSSSGTDPIAPADIGAASQADLEALQDKVAELSEFIQGIENADEKSY